MKIKRPTLFTSTLLLIIGYHFWQSKLAVANLESKIGKEILEGTDDLAQEIAKRGVKEVISPSLIGKILIGILLLAVVGKIILNIFDK